MFIKKIIFLRIRRTQRPIPNRLKTLYKNNLQPRLPMFRYDALRLPKNLGRKKWQIKQRLPWSQQPKLLTNNYDPRQPSKKTFHR